MEVRLENITSEGLRLREFLDRKADQYNNPAFIASDPISIPGMFTRKQDREIAGFFAAIFSWGNRITIIRKSRELLNLMENEPYHFCMNLDERGMKALSGF